MTDRLSPKQFRASEDPSRYCYQAVTMGAMSFTKFNGMGLLGEQAVMLGDTPYDIEAGRRAGLHVVAFECGGWAAADLSGADEIYADAADLLNRYDGSIFSRLAPSRHTSSL